jgi:alpha-D-ribose 1-methylphosphonate 5-triphosphate diphosphatase
MVLSRHRAMATAKETDMPLMPPIRLIGARVLRDGALIDDALTLADGQIAQGPAPEVDLSGFWVLPGIIDLHGDGFERHLTPRHGAPFDKPRALRSVAAELAANGITTAWLAQSWSWEGGFRGADQAEALMAALDTARPGLLPDIRLQLRLETHVLPDHPRMLAAVARHGIDFVIFNNHLPEALEMARHQPRRLAQWAAQSGRTAEEMLAIVQAAQAQDAQVPAALADVAARMAAQGVRLGSHDDGDAATREFYRGIGAPIAEFPTSVAAAAAARAAGEPVLMGAPNVVRGGSQSGNIAAEALVADGLCDALMSDYYYPALAQSAFALAERGTRPFAAAWDMVSAAPARIMGLTDRGQLEPGHRADLVIVDPRARTIEATIAGGCLAHAHGTAARRLMARAA